MNEKRISFIWGIYYKDKAPLLRSFKIVHVIVVIGKTGHNERPTVSSDELFNIFTDIGD